MNYYTIIEKLPEEWHLAMFELADAIETSVRERLAVRREDFDKLQATVNRLAEAQERTEQGLNRLAEVAVRREDFDKLQATVNRLAEAQERTEQELNRLAEVAVRQEDFDKLQATVNRLAEAQERTEQQVDRLAEAEERLTKAQERTEQRLDRLAEAQARTEQRLDTLAEAQVRTERAVTQLAKQVGGLSETVGGDIEDIAYIVLYDVLKREFNWDVGELERVWQTWGKEPEEVNILGQATDPARPETPIWIVGEAKHNLTKREVKKFINQVGRARKHLKGEIFPVCFCYRARPEVRQLVTEANIRLVFSYGKLV